MPLPSTLPDNPWGFLAVVAVVLGSLLMAVAKKSSTKDAVKTGDTDAKLQAVIDAFTERVEMVEEKLVTMEEKYRASLRYARDWRELHPGSIDRVEVPKEIQDDI